MYVATYRETTQRKSLEIFLNTPASCAMHASAALTIKVLVMSFRHAIPERMVLRLLNGAYNVISPLGRMTGEIDSASGVHFKVHNCV